MSTSLLPAFFSWTVVGIVSGLLLGAGFSVMSMSPPAFLMAKICFTLAAIVFFARVGFWLASSAGPASERIGLTALICAVGGVCWVESIHWVDVRQPQVKRTGAPNDKRRLVGRFLQTIVGSTSDLSASVGFVEMTVTNEDGGRTTVKPDSWSLTVTTVDGVRHRGDLVAIADGTKMQMADGKTAYTIGPADAIYEKTSSGIDPGTIAHGWIEATFRGLGRNDLVSAGAKWEINFEDHLGTNCIASYEYRGRERLPGPTYYPGGGIRPTEPSSAAAAHVSQPTVSHAPSVDRSVKIGDGDRLTNSPIITGDQNSVNLNDDWSLTAAQQQTLHGALVSLTASVRIWEIFNDRHSHKFSQDIGKLLSTIPGWDAEWGNGEVEHAFPGVLIEVGHTDFPAAAEIQRQLRAMGIPANGALTAGLPPNQINLHVGTRPEP